LGRLGQKKKTWSKGLGGGGEKKSLKGFPHAK